MAIYKMVGDKDRLEEIALTSFGQEGVLERSDLQRMLRDQPDVLEEGLLIISEEFGNWQDSNRRIDLLALDATGRLVVIELKRGETGEHMDLQAIRYAAMVAALTSENIIEAHRAYLSKMKIEGDAEEYIRRHLETTDFEDIHTGSPRIILVSEGFSTELTTGVLWLNDRGLDITCIQLQAYRNEPGLLLESSQVIPVPGTEGLVVKGYDNQKKADNAQRQLAPKRTTQGGDAFRETIGQAPEQFRKDLQRLYDFAIELEKAELVELSTYFNRKGDYVRLELRVPGKGQLLVSFNNLLWQGDERGGEITIWPNEEGLAPNSFANFDQLIRPVKSRSKFRHRRLSTVNDLETILRGIRDVFREASGLPARDNDGES